jgi:CheY-like chemotaxis protein
LQKFQAALQRELPVDMVITDLGMPDMGGRRLAQFLRELSPEVRILLLTGWGARMQAEQDKPAEVDAVVTKPPRLNTLREAISDVMGAGAGRA